VSGRTRRVAGLVAWVAFLVAAIAFLHGAGRGPLAPPPLDGRTRAWLDERDAAEATFAVVRLLALALAWYLLATTAAGVLVRLARAGRLVAFADAVSVPAVRRLVEGAIGVSLAAAALTATGELTGTGHGARPAAAEAPAPEDVVMRRLPDEDRDEVVMRRLPDGQVPPVAAVPAEWTVEPGDHLWAVAEAVLTRAWLRPPSDAEATPYWLRLIEANRDRLADRENPDLVFPGQVMVVPPPPPPPS
jgi:nucleoid-associated protein YgaU